MPDPDSILTARLVTALDSAKTPRATPVEAAITEPVFSSDHQLIVGEGARLRGAVTFAPPARRLHRNGQLRFLFESIQLPDERPTNLLASLHSVDVSRDDRIALDEEGGARVANSNARFVAPALAILALRASVDQRTDVDEDEIDPATGTARRRSRSNSVVQSSALRPSIRRSVGVPVAAVRVLTLESGRPVNPLTGADEAHTQAFRLTARPLGMARNSLRLPAAANVDLRVLRFFTIKPHGKLDIVVEAFNSLNRVNVTQLNAVFGPLTTAVPTFGRPVDVAAARRIQASVDFEF